VEENRTVYGGTVAGNNQKCLLWNCRRKQAELFDSGSVAGNNQKC
jgi:hypothetical protein